MIILDTNVLSEALKPAPSGAVLNWLAAQEPGSTFTTAITEAELLYGVEVLPKGKRRTQLLEAVERILDQEFENRILPFDHVAARHFAKIAASRSSAGRPISQLDAMIAAIARSYGAAIATRNTADFAHCGVQAWNPWTDS